MKQANVKGKQEGGDKRGEFGDGGSGEGEKELGVAGDGQCHGEEGDGEDGGQEEKQAVEGHPGAAGLHCRVQFTWW